MLTIVNGFERLRTEYESCRDFHEIYAELKDGIARKLMDLFRMMGIYF